MPLLTRLRVADAMTAAPCLLDASQHVGEARALMSAAGVRGAPVLDDQGRLAGVVEKSDLVRLTDEERIGSVVDDSAATVRPELPLAEALEALETTPGGWTPVLDDDLRVIGVLGLGGVAAAYRRRLAGAEDEFEASWARSAQDAVPVMTTSSGGGPGGHTVSGPSHP